MYGVNQLLAALTYIALRAYASRKKILVDVASADRMGPRHSIPAIVILAFAIGFVFVNVYASLGFLFLVPLLYFVPANRWF